MRSKLERGVGVQPMKYECIICGFTSDNLQEVTHHYRTVHVMNFMPIDRWCEHDTRETNKD